MNKEVKTKNVALIVALNEIAWYVKDETQNKLKQLPLSIQFVIKKNMRNLQNMVNDFNSFKESKEQELRDKWFSSDEFSEPTKVVQDGEEVDGRKIKDEYFEAYQEEVKTFNEQLEKLLGETDEIKYTQIDLDEFVEKAENTEIELADVDMISLFDSDEGE